MRGDVLVVGESLIDVVRRGGEEDEVVGGSPANVALGLARLGAPVRFHTALGHDDRGERIAAHLSAAGVEVVGASWSLPKTSTALAQIGADGAARYTFDLVWRLPVEPEPEHASVIHTGSLAAFLEPGASVVQRTLAGARPGTLITIDPNIRAALLPDHAAAVRRFEGLLRLATVVKLSDEDAAWLYPDLPHDALLRRLLAAGPRLVALTRGGSGATLAAGDILHTVAAPAVTVRDTVGAGDTFMAALIAYVLQNPAALSVIDRDDLDRMGTYAVTAAAITVERVGADLPTAADVRRALV